MNRILLLRHAQASAAESDYDRLSDLGHRQAQRLGRFWRTESLRFDRVYLGDLLRQRQTLQELVLEMTSDQVSWPEFRVLPALNEHEGIGIVAKAAPALASKDPEIARWVEENQVGPTMSLASQLRIYRRVTRAWARGELDQVVGDLETFKAFRKRVASGFDRILAGAKPDESVLVVTSGGPIAAIIGEVLGLTDEKVLELSWVVKNTSISEVNVAAGEPIRVFLRSFNELPHLRQQDLITYV